MHVSPSENEITRNFSLSRTYGDEEFDGGCPIQFGQPFEILIKTLQGQFNVCFNSFRSFWKNNPNFSLQILINGRYFCKFLHRIPVIFAKMIHINGDVKINSITLEEQSERDDYIRDVSPLISELIYLSFQILCWLSIWIANFLQYLYLETSSYGQSSSSQHSDNNRATVTTSMSPEYYQDNNEQSEARPSSYEPRSSIRNYSDQHSPFVQHIKYQSRGTNTWKSGKSYFKDYLLENLEWPWNVVNNNCSIINKIIFKRNLMKSKVKVTFPNRVFIINLLNSFVLLNLF